MVFGGVKINPQMLKLRRGVDILVATPGRLMDLYSQNAVKFDRLEVLVLDEADRMLDMGFIHDIKRIIGLLPRRRQNLMFSATFSDDIRALAKGLVRSPVEISVTPNNSTAPSVEQWIYPVDKKQKSALLIKLIKDGGWGQALVFAKTKHGANKLTKKLESEGITAAAIHGNKSQSARTRALADFKAGEMRILVATDIAARGLDIEQLPQVVNFDLPNVSEDYVHRIGRTGRAGLTGCAISLVSADEVDLLSDIERLTKKLIERRVIDGFEPDQNLPETSLMKGLRHKRPRKPLNSASSNPYDFPQHKKSNNPRKRSAFGHGPKPSSKLKSDHSNQNTKPAKRSKGSSTKRGDAHVASSSGSGPKKTLRGSFFSSGGDRNASGRNRNRPLGGNSHRR